MAAPSIKTAAYASGVTYPMTPDIATTLTSSGMDTLILWAFHIHTNGDIIFNDTTLFTYDTNSNTSSYGGDPNWPAAVGELIGSNSSITTIEASIGGWDTGDFANIKTIYENNNNSFEGTPLQSNFELFKSTLSSVSLIDMDVEDLYDQPSFIAFCQMLIDIGFGITFCPYTNSEFWTGALVALPSGSVKWWNLQCYAGGAGNDPSVWAGYIKEADSSFDTNGYIYASDWSRFFNTQYSSWQGDCVKEMHEMLSNFKGEATVGGGFLWNVDQVVDYKSTMAKHPDPCKCPADKRSLADYLTAIKSALD